MAMNAKDSTELRYLEPGRAAIAGAPCTGMKILGATGRALGHLQGFIVDPVARQLRYFVVRSGRLGKALLLPVTDARVDVSGKVIELLGDTPELTGMRFTPELYPAL